MVLKEDKRGTGPSPLASAKKKNKRKKRAKQNEGCMAEDMGWGGERLLEAFQGVASCSIAGQCNSKWKEVGNSGNQGGFGVVEQGHGARWRKHHRAIKLLRLMSAAWSNIFCTISNCSVVFPLKVSSVTYKCCQWLGELSAQTPIRFDTRWLIMADRTLYFAPGSCQSRAWRLGANWKRKKKKNVKTLTTSSNTTDFSRKDSLNIVHVYQSLEVSFCPAS